MKRLTLILFLFLASCTTPGVHPPPPELAPLVWSVYFSPKGRCTSAIVKELDNAKSSILMQTYSFTSAPIAKALVAAHERGVKVEVILDKSNLTARYTSGPFVVKAGIRLR